MWRIKPEDMGRAEEAKRFMVNYYRTFDTNRAGLVNLYREESVLNYDGREIKGKEAILAKLTSLPQCHHEIAEFKCMPYRTGSVLISVYGETWVGGQNVMADALISDQTFLLMPAPEGSFCVGTQIWRPFDLNKVRTPPPASKPTPTFAFLMSTLTSPPPTPMSAFALQTAVRMSGTTSPAYVSAPAPPMAALTSSESTSSTSSVSASSVPSGSALALPMSRMKITSAPPMSLVKHP
ncbi:hypothetical protein ACJRO7_032590 [Eucalyptus globulus]|uniref:NTF2 domain-containing protein n=1 Tax=Eucalyptus globulus TaxID=34317 RepID=A0ABD3JNQ6_EUCGL